MPAMFTVLGPDSAQPPPASVMVTTLPEVVAVAVHDAKPAPSVIAGVDGTVNALSKVTTMCWPAPRFALGLLGVKVTAHDAVTPPVCGVPANATADGAVAAEITTSAGEPG